MGDDRERRSWREIDRMRDGSGPRRGPKKQEPKGHATGYSRYKSELNRLFDRGQAAGHVSHVMRKAKDTAPGEEADGGDGRADLVRACRLAEDHGQLVATVDALLESGPLPDDVELLLRVVDHPKEAVQADALERIERLIRRKPLKRKAAFVQRLYGLEHTAEDPALRDVVNRLIEELA